MPRRTLARRNLLTFSAEPWTLMEGEPGTGGGGGGGAPQLNEHGYPDNTPTADMSTEHQVAYWKHHARKHEAASKAGPDAAELERLRAADAELATRKAAELSDVERVQAEKATAEAAAATARADADAAVRKALLLEVAMSKSLTPAQAARLQGSTKEELEADADALLKDFAPAGGTGTYRVGGDRGSDVGSTGGVTSGAERFRQKHGK
ncbi:MULTISPECIES: hypothetical protein [unclassified Streptomyces]|uniref:hypothetical protein n=1 Tax=unclassified Streptomyces TaxID=2593676 RepID=UPI0003A66933|nr:MULTISPECIES: hypothetical protein [unclassified Streptomyces]